MKALLVATILLGCQHEGSDSKDPCERAAARMARLNPAMTAPQQQRIREECHGKYGRRDPILACALDSASDDAAAACMDQVVKTVVKPH
ncbi:MAG: hypothetical protein QM831_35015 [Kofleriaceae bacterium]